MATGGGTGAQPSDHVITQEESLFNLVFKDTQQGKHFNYF